MRLELRLAFGSLAVLMFESANRPESAELEHLWCRWRLSASPRDTPRGTMFDFESASDKVFRWSGRRELKPHYQLGNVRSGCD